MDDGLNPVSKVVAFVVMALSTVWLTWCTIIAFTGGTLPLLGWRVDGGLIFGLFWLFVLDAIAMTVAYWVSMLVALPLILISEAVGVSARRPPRP